MPFGIIAKLAFSFAGIPYRLLRVIYPVFRVLFRDQVIRADDLARAMVDVAVQRKSERASAVFENREIRAMAEQLHPAA
jgi:hypothetical protein